jgi:hypothetical protein
MSIRFSISAASDSATDAPVVIDAFHIPTDGSWFEHPIRSHNLRLGFRLDLLAHVALGFVVHKGDREELTLGLTHDDPKAQHGLELVVMDVPTLPGADGYREGDDACELSWNVIAPGGALSITLSRGTSVRIREVLMSEADHG